jgi:hypothetical protein
VSLNDKSKITQDYDRRVEERTDLLVESMYRPAEATQNTAESSGGCYFIGPNGCSIPTLEADRIQKELQLTQGLLDFNQRVDG